MEFNGALGREGASIGIWIHIPINKALDIPPNVRISSYKLAFDLTNNEAEYEALIVGLNFLKKLGVKKISVYGDSELVIKQVKGEYKANRPKMRAYRNAVLDILKTFPEYTLSLIPRNNNVIADSLATSASMLKIPLYLNKNMK